MPPLKEYIFEDLSNSMIRITINSYSFEQAYELLVETTKHPSNFKCINV